MTADKLIAAYHNAELHYDDTGDIGRRHERRRV
jgi:hypothetical protein